MAIDTPEIRVGCLGCHEARTVYCDNRDVLTAVTRALHQEEIPYWYTQLQGASEGGSDGLCNTGGGEADRYFARMPNVSVSLDDPCENAARIISLMELIEIDQQVIIG